MINGYNSNIQYQYPPYILPKYTQINNNVTNNTQSGVVYSNPVYYTPPYGVQYNNYIKIGVQKAPNGQEFHIYQLKTGQKVAIAKGAGAPLIETCVYVGAFDENPDKNGISHLIEHSLFHGSRKYGDTLLEQAKQTGADYNAATTGYYTNYYFKIDNQNIDNLKKAIDIQADMLLNPTFSNIEKELSIVKREADEYCTNETKVFENFIFKNLYSLNDFKAKALLSGDGSTLDSITKDDILNYYSKYYRPDNMATVVISNAEPDELIKHVAKSFSKAAEGKNYPPVLERKSFSPTQTMKRIDYISKETDYGSVAFAFAVPNSIPEQDKTNLDALIELLELRNYNFLGAFGDENSQYSTIKLHTLLFDLNENEQYRYLQRELNNVISEPPTEQELKQIKNKLSNGLDYLYANNQESATTVALELITEKNINLLNRKNAIANITAEGITNALKYIDFNKLSMGVLHPKGTSVEDIQKKYNSFISSVPAVILPKRTENINILNSIKSYNIEPYSLQPVQTALLPNNTRFVAVESKNNKCNVSWELYNPNVNTENPALELVLGKMNPYSSSKNETGIGLSCDYTNGIYKIQAECPTSALAEVIKNMKFELDIDFNEKDLEKAKNSVLKDINSFGKHVIDKREKELKGIQNNDEIKACLDKLTLNDLTEYFNDIINNAYSTAVVSAPFSQNPELLNSVASAINIPDFTFKKPDEGIFKNNYVNKTTSNYYISEEEDSFPEYYQIYNFKISGNQEDTIKLKLLNYVMNSRLYNDLREKQGLCYTPRSVYSSTGNSGELWLYVQSSAASKEEIKKIFDGFKINTDRLKTENITEEELNYAKSQIRLKILDLFDDMRNVHSDILEMMKEPMGISAMQNVTRIIDGITVEDIRAAANYVFREKPDYLINADKNTLEANKDYFASLGKIK